MTAIWPGGTAWGAGLLGAAFIGSLYLSGRVLDVSTPLFGAGLLVMVELAQLSSEMASPRTRAGAGPGVAARRLAFIGAVAAGSALAGFGFLALAAAPVDGGLVVTAAGLLAAVGAVALIAWLVRRGPAY